MNRSCRSTRTSSSTLHLIQFQTSHLPSAMRQRASMASRRSPGPRRKPTRAIEGSPQQAIPPPSRPQHLPTPPLLCSCVALISTRNVKPAPTMFLPPAPSATTAPTRPSIPSPPLANSLQPSMASSTLTPLRPEHHMRFHALHCCREHHDDFRHGCESSPHLAESDFLQRAGGFLRDGEWDCVCGFR